MRISNTETRKKPQRISILTEFSFTVRCLPVYLVHSTLRADWILVNLLRRYLYGCGSQISIRHHNSYRFKCVKSNRKDFEASERSESDCRADRESYGSNSSGTVGKKCSQNCNESSALITHHTNSYFLLRWDEMVKASANKEKHGKMEWDDWGTRQDLLHTHTSRSHFASSLSNTHTCKWCC